jgi:hypothetical protein
MEFIKFLDSHTWIATVLTIISTVAIAVWNIGRQLENTVRAQRANKMDELHTAIYKEIAEKIADCEKALVKTNGTTRMLPSTFVIKRQSDEIAKSYGLPESSQVIRERFPQICAEHFATSDKFAEVLMIMEKYELVFADFSNMKAEICLKYEKFMCAASSFHKYVLVYLPMDIEEPDRFKFNGEKVVMRPFPSQSAIDEMRRLSDEVLEPAMDLSAFLHDLRIESQNTLLSPIFGGKKAPKRVPGDPSYPVLSRDSHK